MNSSAGKESVFISGLDATVTEADIKDFLKQINLAYEPQIRLHTISIFDRSRVLGEVGLATEDAIRLLDSFACSRIKNCIIKLISRGNMRSLIINNIPDVMNEKDFFLILNKATPNLKRVVIADDSEIPGKTLGVAVASYHTNEDALNAISKLNNLDVLGKRLNCSWKDPNFDIITELSFETRVLYLKNISSQTTVPRLKEICEKHGRVLRIKKYATKAFVEFDSIKSAKDAYESLNEKRIDGLVWKIFPARKYDAEKERDLPDRNICFSKNFISEADQQVLLKFAFDGTIPEIDEKILNSCNKIIENVKAMQKMQVDNLNAQLESFKMMQQSGSSKGGVNPNVNMMMLYLMNMNPMMSGMNPMMGGMNPMMGGMNMGNMPGGQQNGQQGGQGMNPQNAGQNSEAMSGMMNQMMGGNMSGGMPNMPAGQAQNMQQMANQFAQGQAMQQGGQAGVGGNQNRLKQEDEAEGEQSNQGQQGQMMNPLMMQNMMQQMMGMGGNGMMR